mgnify:CR=1 FL=1
MRQCRLVVVVFICAAALWPAVAVAQEASSNRGTSVDMTNPVSIIDNASRALPLSEPDGLTEVREDMGLSATLSIIALLTVLTLAPALLVMTTSFTRIIVVLALLRQAIGTQTLPPSQVITGLALFMTFLVMAPTFSAINRDAIVPLQSSDPAVAIDEREAWARARGHIRRFMFDQIEHAGNESDIYMMLNYQGIDTSDPDQNLRYGDVDMVALIPAFILSELKVAFLMGFRLYLPFLIIDMVISSVLISMGMLMLPPVLISLPFKLLLFVLVDGWQLVAGNLLHSFAVPGVTT